MKTHFIKLFDYDQYANLLLLKSILQVNAAEKPVQLITHLLAAQQVWLNRMQGLPAANSNIWPGRKAETFEKIIYENHLLLLNFLNHIFYLRENKL